MAVTRRIFISSPRDEHLDARRVAVKSAIVGAIEGLGYEAQMFGSAEGGRGLASGVSWSATDAEKVMRRCVGAAVLGFPIWDAEGAKTGKQALLVSEYCHYEGALARMCGLPILAALEESVDERVFFSRIGGTPTFKFGAQADSNWVTQPSFVAFRQRWDQALKKRSDVFLAYSSKLTPTAQSIASILTDLGVKVLDWRTFVGGSTILEQIREAAAQTTGGIFLFTADEPLGSAASQGLPRDNVLFEAGFFAHAKGHERSLIIREPGAKMPADLGGVVYETLGDRSNVTDLKERIARFVEAAL